MKAAAWGRRLKTQCSRVFVALLTIVLSVCVARTQDVDLTCFPISGGGGSDPIVRIHVSRNNGNWQILHYSSKGKSYDRASQYWISDQSGQGSISWIGSLVNRNDVKMVGTVIEKNGASFYKERVFNTHKAGTDIVENSASCVGKISWAKAEPPPEKNYDPQHLPVLTPPPNKVAGPVQPDVGPEWSNALTAAKQHMMECLKHFPSPQDGVENAVEVEVRRYIADCGQDYMALWRQGGETPEQSVTLAEMEAYKAFGCRIANPDQEEIRHTPDGLRMVSCSSEAKPSPAESSPSMTPGGTPVEPRAVIYHDDQTPLADVLKAADQAAGLVRANGYRCDSVSAFRPFLWGLGYKLVCNEFRYEYDVEDKGGRWEVTVK